MSAGPVRQPPQPPVRDKRSPFGPFSLDPETQPSLTVPDAVRRCRWIAVDVNAMEFGVFFVSPSVERARLVPCFDSEYPRVSTATKFVSGSNGEVMVKHTRHSTLPCWWSDPAPSSTSSVFSALDSTVRTAELVPGMPGIAFPVYADRGQCGLVIFLGHDMAMSAEEILEIHARCFSLFASISLIRPADKTPAISKRELECLKLTAKGFTSDEIAAALKLSVHTANQYLTSTAQKLNATNRMHAVAKALRLGLIE